jgi:hypothetical protein
MRTRGTPPRGLRCLADQDVDTARHAERDLPGVGLTDTLERASRDPERVIDGRVFAGFVFLGLAALIALATFQWATRLTDDIGAARESCEVRR